MSTVDKTYTPADLLKMPDGNRYELVDGQLVETTISLWSSYVAGNADYFLRSYCRSGGTGWVLPEGTTYQCFQLSPGKVRKPDVSVIRVERLSIAEAQREGHVTMAPDVAVEVISPNDVASEVQEKVEDYLQAGVALLWVIYPESKTVYVYHRGNVKVLHEHDELSGEELLPGFSCRIAELFRPPAKAR